MNVKEMADTLIIWTGTCTNTAQLEVIDGLIDRYLIKRYPGNKDLSMQVSRVLMALREQSAGFNKPAFSSLNMN